jgi:hypothetical protein
VHRHIAWIALPTLLALAGCGSIASNQPAGSQGQGLQVGPGASVDSATYTLVGPNDFASAGTVPVGASADVPVALGHLPIGQGYELALSAIASDGVTACNGGAVFDVSDSSVNTSLVVHLECAVPTGEANIQASLNICPVLDSLDAGPTELVLGGVALLRAAGHDSDHSPSALQYSWSVNGFKLPNKTTPTLGFACTSPGQVTISASVSDGDPDPACSDSLSAKVTCQ